MSKRTCERCKADADAVLGITAIVARSPLYSVDLCATCYEAARKALEVWMLGKAFVVSDERDGTQFFNRPVWW